MPDYDPENIPVLDDIIKDENDEMAGVHEKIVITDEMQEDDNTLDLFKGTTAEIEINIDDAEPEIGSIEQVADQVIDEDIAIDTETVETVENETPDDAPAVFESALITYPLEDDAEQSLEPQSKNETSSETINADENHSDEEQNELPENINETAAITEPTINLDLDRIIDDVVTQMMPELEQQLRTRLRLALQEQADEQKTFVSTDERR